MMMMINMMMMMMMMINMMMMMMILLLFSLSYLLFSIFFPFHHKEVITIQFYIIKKRNKYNTDTDIIMYRTFEKKMCQCMEIKKTTTIATQTR